MIDGVATWGELPLPERPVLLVLNTPAGQTTAAQIAFDRLAEWLGGPEALHVIAPASWLDWVEARGVSADRLLIARDELGRDVELMHFLNTGAALEWIFERAFAAVMGTQPHNLHNEEVQEVFEGQVLMFLRDGRLLAHTLPSSYVYVFDLEMLASRFGRSHALEEYRATAARVLGALHRRWQVDGCPATTDTSDYTDVLAPLAEHLEPWILRFDENGPWPAPAKSPRSLRQVLDRLSARLAESQLQLAERNRAVTYRDTLLAEERARYDATLDARVRRVAGRVSRLLKGK